VTQEAKISSLKDNFGLSQQDFAQFAKKVKNGDESLFIRVFNLHFRDSVRYIQNKFNIPEDLAYDVCMETMLDFRSKLKQGKIKYGNMRYLYTKMATNHYVDGQKKKSKVQEAISVFHGDRHTGEIDEQEFFTLLNRAVEDLEESPKHMIKEIFFSGKNKEQIQQENEISSATFRKRKQRSLEKLKSTFLELLNAAK